MPQAANTPPVPEFPSLSLKDLAKLLVIHQGLHEGIYDIVIGFQIAVGAIGPTKETVLPGAMFGVSNIALIRSDIEGPHTVDAAKINPKPTTKKTTHAAKISPKPAAKKGL